MPFPGFSDADFAAYAPSRWRSNVFNRERLEVKQKLLVLAKEAGGHLAAADGGQLTLEASVEHPALWNHKQVDAQHVFFFRSEAARKELDRIIDRERGVRAMLDDPTPQHTHIFLALTLRETGVEAALRLHPDAKVDRENLLRRAADPRGRASLLQALRGMEAGFELGLSGAPLVAAEDTNDEALTGLVTAFAGSGSFLVLERRWPREEAIRVGAALAAEARAVLDTLAGAFHLIAWTRDNDFVSMGEKLERERETVRRRGLARTDRVRIVRGLLAGKQGVIQEIDGRGALKVLVGKVAVKLAAEDVVKQ